MVSYSKCISACFFTLAKRLCLFFHPRRRNAGILPSLEDLLFYTVAEGQEKIPAHKFLTVSPFLKTESSFRVCAPSTALILHTRPTLALKDYASVS